MAGPMSKFKDQIKSEVEKRIAKRKTGETTLGKPLPRDSGDHSRLQPRNGAGASVARVNRTPSAEIELWPERFITGAKVYFAGKLVPITIHLTGVDRVEVEYDDRITVRIPISAAYRGRDETVKNALVNFYAEYLAAETAPLVRRYAAKIGIIEPEVVIEYLEKALGRFGEHGEIVFNASLAYAPKFVIEYIVVHELVFRRVKNKESEFWRAIETVMPDYRLRAEWLRQNAEILRRGLPVSVDRTAEVETPRDTVTPKI